MHTLIGRQARNFVAISTEGELELYAWLPRAGVLGFCPTPPDARSDQMMRALARQVQPQLACAAIVPAPLAVLLARRAELGVLLPMVADPERVIAAAYGLERDERPSIVLVTAGKRVEGVWRYPDESGGALERVVRRVRLDR